MVEKIIEKEEIKLRVPNHQKSYPLCKDFFDGGLVREIIYARQQGLKHPQDPMYKSKKTYLK